MHRREAAAAEPYTLSNVEYYEKNQLKWVKSATAIESFPGIRYDMEKLFLAAYFCEVAYELSDERQPAGAILPLTLNSLYMLSTTKGEDSRIKAAFEMRAAVIAGFSPDTARCRRCGTPAVGGCRFDVMNGAPLCAACAERLTAFVPDGAVDEFGDRRLYLPLGGGGLSAISYIADADEKRVFSFRLTDEAEQRALSAVTEAYLLHHLERGFQTLENYKKLTAIVPSKKEE